MHVYGVYSYVTESGLISGMSGHGHSHGGGCEGEGHGHDHDHTTDAERGSAYSLYLKIDTERVQCLNEAEDGSAKYIFKSWDQRLDKEKVGL